MEIYFLNVKHFLDFNTREIILVDSIQEAYLKYYNGTNMVEEQQSQSFGLKFHTA